MSASLQTESPWCLRVDIDGQIDPAGTYVARPPVPYYGGRTVRRTGIDDMTAAREARQDKAFLDRVIFIASQRPHSRALLEFAYQHRLSIRFDADYTRGQGAGALVIVNDLTHRTRLSLQPYVPQSNAGPELYRLGTLAHETTHVMRNQAGFTYSSCDSLASIKRMIRIQEDDARVAGTLSYAEFLVNYPGDPANAWRPRHIRQALLDETEETRSAILAGLPDLQRGRIDLYAAKVTASFQDVDRSYYDEYMLRWLTDVATRYRLAGDFDNMAGFMQTNKTMPLLTEALVTLGGKPYLEPGVTHAPAYTRLADTPEVRTAYAALKQEAANYNALGFNPDIRIGFMGTTDPVAELKSIIPPAYMIPAAQVAARLTS